MQQEFQIQVNPEVAQNQEALKKVISKDFKIQLSEIKHIEILKRSIDARQQQVKVNLKIKVYIQEEFIEKLKTDEEFNKKWGGMRENIFE